MTTNDTLTPVNTAELPELKHDGIGEEYFAARQYSKRLTRTVVIALCICQFVSLCAIVALAMRPAKRVYIKIDQLGRATPVKYSDLEHYTPDAAVAKSYLADWARFRFERLRGTVLQTFPKNYLFLERDFGMKVRERDQHENVAANIVAGREVENDLTILATNLTSFGKQTVAGVVVPAGTAEIAIQKRYQRDGDTKTQTWVIAVRFYLNPDQVDSQSADDPDYQTINPLGLTIVEFILNRANVEAEAKH